MIFIPKENDLIVTTEMLIDSQDSDTRNLVTDKLIHAYKTGNTVNKLRHIKTCTICAPTQQEHYLQDNEKILIADCSIFIENATTNGKIIFSSTIFHMIAIHNKIPRKELLGNYGEQLFSSHE